MKSVGVALGAVWLLALTEHSFGDQVQRALPPCPVPECGVMAQQPYVVVVGPADNEFAKAVFRNFAFDNTPISDHARFIWIEYRNKDELPFILESVTGNKALGSIGIIATDLDFARDSLKKFENPNIPAFFVQLDSTVASEKKLLNANMGLFFGADASRVGLSANSFMTEWWGNYKLEHGITEFKE